jgi:DNA polymerase III subunit delta
MARELLATDVLKSLEKGDLAPVYLFYGQDEFTLERTLSRIREEFIPGSSRDFNLEICYGGDENADPYNIINRAETMPFLAGRRLVIVRRTEKFTTDQLEKFLPYLEDPVKSTCLIFIASKTDFRIVFYKRIKDIGLAVNFTEIKGRQVVPWIRQRARELGINISEDACIHLQEIVGDRPIDLYNELIKLQLRYGDGKIGEEEVKGMAIYGRIYSIFNLTDALSTKNIGEYLSALNSFLEEEDKKSGPLRLTGMLNRQIGLLWQTKALLEKGAKPKDLVKKLGVQSFIAEKLMKQSRHWSIDDLEEGIALLQRADRLIKSGSRPKPVFESLFMSLCS